MCETKVPHGSVKHSGDVVYMCVHTCVHVRVHCVYENMERSRESQHSRVGLSHPLQ